MYSEEMKGWTVNTQINLLAGVINGASALDQIQIGISIAAAMSYFVSHAANPEMILVLRCQLLNISCWSDSDATWSNLKLSVVLH